MAVVGQLILLWPSTCSSLPSKIPGPQSGAWEGLAQGPGHCTYLPPYLWVLQHYLLTDHNGLPALPPSQTWAAVVTPFPLQCMS